MTGCYPHQVGVIGNGYNLDADCPYTAPRLLKPAGTRRYKLVNSISSAMRTMTSTYDHEMIMALMCSGVMKNQGVTMEPTCVGLNQKPPIASRIFEFRDQRRPALSGQYASFDNSWFLALFIFRVDSRTNTAIFA